MNSKKVKILIDNKIVDAILEEDESFYGGSKVTYQIEEGKKCMVSANLVMILKENSMKELTDGELIDLAKNQIKIMDKHLISQFILCALIIIQAIFLIFDIISINFYFCVWIISMGLYVFHRKRIKNTEIKVQEIVDELTSRNI